MLEEAINIVSTQMRDEEQARASNTIALSQQLVLAAGNEANGYEHEQDQPQETFEQKLERAVDRPVIATVVEIPSDLTQRATRPMIDASAHFNTSQIKAWRHPGEKAESEAYTAAKWLWLVPTLILRKPTEQIIRGAQQTRQRAK